MEVEPTSGTSGSPQPGRSNSNPKPSTSGKESDKITTVAKKSLTPEEREAIRLDDREYLIEDIIATKGVKRRIAELEVDS